MMSSYLEHQHLKSLQLKNWLYILRKDVGYQVGTITTAFSTDSWFPLEYEIYLCVRKYCYYSWSSAQVEYRNQWINCGLRTIRTWLFQIMRNIITSYLVSISNTKSFTYTHKKTYLIFLLVIGNWNNPNLLSNFSLHVCVR